MTEQTPRKNAAKTRGKPFEPGNPGKPKGARHKTTRALEALLEGEAQEIGRKVIEKAKGGDMTACRLVLERLLPPARDRPIELPDLPEVRTPEEITEAVAVVIRAAAGGDLTPTEAATMADLLERQRRAVELLDLDKRLSALEAQK